MLGKIFGAVIATFGILLTILELIDIAGFVKNYPNMPKPEDIINSTIFVLVIGIVLAFAGIMIFRKW